MTVRQVVVAVPARDEEVLLGRCLTSVGVAVDRLHRWRPQIRCDVVITLDACRDGSAQVASGYPVTVVEGHGRGVGQARDTAIETGLSMGVAAGIDLQTGWIACTDADTQVPAHWLTSFVTLADAGADLVLGTVDPVDCEPALRAAWRARHVLAEGHDHVHGANLGIRASGYVQVGGFAPVRVHEDTDLVTRAQAAGLAWVATDSLRVRTSARQTSRVAGGFATYLAELRAGEPG